MCKKQQQTVDFCKCVFSAVASNSNLASLFQLIVQFFLIVTVISSCNLIG